VLKGTVGEAVKDAYKALKGKIAHWAGLDVEALESAPASKARRDVIAEIIDSRSVDELAEVRALAERLIAACKSNGGPDASQWDALGRRIANATVTGGTVGVAGYNEVHGSQQNIILGGSPTKNRRGSG
jgi:hypothetical protein